MAGNAQQHKYYCIGDSLPVRVTFNTQGLKIGAEIPNENTGALEIKTTLLSRLENGEDVEEIDRAAFEALCARIYSKKNDSHLRM